MIEKVSNAYQLTLVGKEFVGRMNDQDMSVEKQPKVSVMIIPYKMVKGKRMMLVNKRLKQPYYGKVGDFTGKVRFGEGIEQAAKREFFEETGLTAQFKFAKCIRKIAYIEQEIVQDNVIYLFTATKLKGDLIEDQGELHNFWIEEKELRKRDDLYSTLLTFIDIAFKNKSKFEEFVVEAVGY